MDGDDQAPGTRLLDHPGGTPTLLLERARLEVVEGPDEGRSVVLERPSLRVGTGPDNDMVLGDTTVSSRHFELLVSEHGCLLRDLGSTNGTFVDGYRVGEIHLRRTARVVAGATKLRFVVLDDEVEIPVARATNFGALLGHSPSMRAAFAVLDRAAASDSTVLVSGESGTGKELAARALHERSVRSDGPYVVFDCGTATASLLESQLFGHAKGAFTGAVQARSGVFEEADGGTLVLDEIGELPLELQPKLLRAVETKTVQRVGEHASRSADVRIVASTNRNLEEEVRQGRFRQDLFYRLSVITATLPPLRDRREEIPRLVRHFLTQLAGDEAPEVPQRVLDLLVAYDWPGNVRELRNFAERFLAMPDAPPASLLPSGAGSAHAPVEVPSPGEVTFHEAKQRWTERFEREYLTRLLETHGGNVTEAARAAGLSRQSCYRLMNKHGIRGE